MLHSPQRSSSRCSTLELVMSLCACVLNREAAMDTPFLSWWCHFMFTFSTEYWCEMIHLEVNDVTWCLHFPLSSGVRYLTLIWTDLTQVTQLCSLCRPEETAAKLTYRHSFHRVTAVKMLFLHVTGWKQSGNSMKWLAAVNHKPTWFKNDKLCLLLPVNLWVVQNKLGRWCFCVCILCGAMVVDATPQSGWCHFVTSFTAE